VALSIDVTFIRVILLTNRLIITEVRDQILFLYFLHLKLNSSLTSVVTCNLEHKIISKQFMLRERD